MISVKNAEPNNNNIVTVMKTTVGPLSTEITVSLVSGKGKKWTICALDPVCLATHPSAIFTGSRRNNVHPTQASRM